MIRNVSESQDEILESIMTLYCPRGFDLDPCFGQGAFYKSGRIPRPAQCFDLIPQHEGVETADVRNLPLYPGTSEAIIFDPPFVHAHGRGSVMGNRYQSYSTQKVLFRFYERAFEELLRVLRPGGILVWKCQDIVESGKQVWNHVMIHVLCTSRGMTAKDLFVLVARHRMAGHNHKRQLHARKFTSYFWVFKK